jgi:hypothetical protein
MVVDVLLRSAFVHKKRSLMRPVHSGNDINSILRAGGSIFSSVAINESGALG